MRRFHVICAVAATGLGLAYLVMAGAPLKYAVVNALALVVGLAVAAIVAFPGVRASISSGSSIVAVGILLLATALFGSSLEGTTRWINIGGLSLQPSLILIPLMVMAYATSREWIATLGMVTAAIAMAWQPDRAMAGTLMAGLGAVFSVRRQGQVGLAFATAILGFIVTMIRPDTLPGMPFVEQVYSTTFGVSAWAGMAVFIGTILMLVPAIDGWRGEPQERPLYLAFSAVWSAVMVAAALGNYPTPVVAYGSSSILGYVISLALLPRRKTQTAEKRQDLS